MNSCYLLFAMLYVCYSFKFHLKSVNKFQYSLRNFAKSRLEKIISNRGHGSRTEVARLILQGRVRINGKIVRSGSEKYEDDIVFEINKQLIEPVMFSISTFYLIQLILFERLH